MPCCLRPALLVRTSMNIRLARCASVVQILLPLMT